MAAVSPSPDQSTEFLKNLSLDSQPKAPEVHEPAKKPSSVWYDAGDIGKAVNSNGNRSTTASLQEFIDPSMCYVPNGYASSAYYYGGYDGPMNEWEDYPRYIGPDGIEIPPHGVYGDCGNMMYHPAYGYAPYGAYSPGSPVPTVGPDGQLYSPQPYQYVAPYYQHPVLTVSQFNSSNQALPVHSGISTSTAGDQGTVPVEPVNGPSKNVANGNAHGSHGSQPSRPTNQSSPAVNSNGTCGKVTPPVQDPHCNSEGQRSGWVVRPALSDGQHGPVAGAPLSSPVSQPVTGSRNQNPPPQLMGMHSSRPTPGMAPASAYMNRVYPNTRLYNHDTGGLRLPHGYGSNGYDSRAHGHAWIPVDSKFKPRGRGNGYLYYSNENIDALNEQNKGPRAARYKNQRGFLSGVTLAVKGQNISLNEKSEDSYKASEREKYNRPEFVTNYSDAKFFVIKSYSEDDIHKSIKYNVWASTPNGNKKLDVAYREASEKASACPIFLLFSVNTSGQFCGLAEMVGPIDFNKSLDYWQQDKWNGCFPVKWHIIKDIPNSFLKHIILENNDNKPVTNSRDTQEVKLEQGLEILKIFKDHASKTCILDDFGFYENRQRQMQESRAKLQQLKQNQKPMWDGKVNTCPAEDKDVTKSKTVKPIEPVVILQKESAQGEAKSSVDSGLATEAGDVAKDAKLASEKRVANGVARV